MSNNVINNEPVHGYKVFNPDWTCKDFQYEVGKTFEENVKPICCIRGFHFCKEAVDCFSYYDFNPKNKVAEIIALGELDTDGNKFCTNKIQIVREIPWMEVLEIVNIGKENTGLVIPEAGFLEIIIQETVTVETETPETGTLDTGIPEHVILDAATLEISTQEIGIPETVVPEIEIPEIVIAETGTPEKGIPEAGIPGTGTNHLLIPAVSIQKNRRLCCLISRQI